MAVLHVSSAPITNNKRTRRGVFVAQLPRRKLTPNVKTVIENLAGDFDVLKTRNVCVSREIFPAVLARTFSTMEKFDRIFIVF